MGRTMDRRRRNDYRLRILRGRKRRAWDDASGRFFIGDIKRGERSRGVRSVRVFRPRHHQTAHAGLAFSIPEYSPEPKTLHAGIICAGQRLLLCDVHRRPSRRQLQRRRQIELKQTPRPRDR